MSARELADEIAAYTARTDWVTCGEIMNRFGDGMRGHMAIEVKPHLLTWAGISSELIEAMRILQTERPLRVVFWPISPLADLCDGSPILAIPTARRMPRGGYKTDHFVHIGLRPVAQLRADELRKAGVDTGGASR